MCAGWREIHRRTLATDGSNRRWSADEVWSQLVVRGWRLKSSGTGATPRHRAQSREQTHNGDDLVAFVVP
jgi:hypothetical protein